MSSPLLDRYFRPIHGAGVAVVLALGVVCAGCIIVPTSGWLTPMPDISTAPYYVPKEKWQSLVNDRATEDEVFERIGRIGY